MASDRFCTSLRESRSVDCGCVASVLGTSSFDVTTQNHRTAKINDVACDETLLLSPPNGIVSKFLWRRLLVSRAPFLLFQLRHVSQA
uniref:Uncharacterized protein n=1 Tax=Physcomitrium patens TaxID=3218 RepID=A0A2K1JBB7_PHYPA|nr:hypothetical protein PHYPA_019114 [Physcomitrium patens]